MLNSNAVKIGFIGYGNMAGATGMGLINSGAIRPDQIFACAKDFDKLSKKAKAEGITPLKTSLEVCEICDIVFVGVKPYMVKEVMEPLRNALDGKIVISLAAGIFYDSLSEILPLSHCVATAPNTPVSVCEGIFICEKENSLTDDEIVFVKALLENLGLFLWLDREHMGIAGTVAGCSPAFVAMFMEALGDAGCKHGLTRPVVYSLIAQMLTGTGKMALMRKNHPGQMKDEVCSPSGTTIVGVSTLEKNGFRFAVIDAIDQIMNKMNQK